MKIFILMASLAMGALMGAATNASADPWKDESGHGRWHKGYERSERYSGRRHRYDDNRWQRRAFKEEYDDGFCKIERKWERNGEYKEERKCRGGYPAYGYRY